MNLERLRDARALVVLAGLSATLAGADDHVALTPPRDASVYVETEYRYTLREFEPPVPVAPVERAGAAHATPEDAAIAWLSAMAGRDREWWLEIWTEESRTRLRAADAAHPERIADWRVRQEYVFVHQRALLTHRVDAPPFVLIGYRFEDLEPGLPPNKVYGQDVVLREVDGQWRVTDELDEDPLRLYWRRPGLRTRKLVR